MRSYIINKRKNGLNSAILQLNNMMKNMYLKKDMEMANQVHIV
jgi:hypothetical protein